MLAALNILGYDRLIAYKKFGGVSGNPAGWFLKVFEPGMIKALSFAGGCTAGRFKIR